MPIRYKGSIKGLVLKDNELPLGYPKALRIDSPMINKKTTIVKIEYYKKSSIFGSDHSLRMGCYVVHLSCGEYHIILEEVVAVVIYG